MGQASDLLNRSILVDVRSMCNLEPNDGSFDNQLIPLINSQLMVAHQFGVGKNMSIVGISDTWEDLLGVNGAKLAAMQSWLGYSVKLLFDPPDNSSVLKSYQDQIQKFEWFLNQKSQSEGTVLEYVTPKQAQIYGELYDYDE